MGNYILTREKGNLGILLACIELVIHFVWCGQDLGNALVSYYAVIINKFSIATIFIRIWFGIEQHNQSFISRQNKFLFWVVNLIL